MIYSYLPTNISINFPVLINLDVHLTASRGNISEEDYASDSLWNKKVREHLSVFLENAYMAVVKSNQDDLLKNNTVLKKSQEHLYKYLPHSEDDASTSSVCELYNVELKSFFNEIIKQPIYLTNKKLFEKRSEVALVSSSLRSYGSDDGEKISSLYKMMEMNSEKLTTNHYCCRYQCYSTEKSIDTYPLSKEWNSFLYKTKADKRFFLDAYDIVESQGGINYFWNYGNKSEETKHVIDTIIPILCKEALGLSEMATLALVPVEDNKGSFILKSHNDITNKKALFFHSKDKSIEDKENSVYIYENKEADETERYAFCDINILLEMYFRIKEYNLVNYFDSELENIEFNYEKVQNFIKKTFGFYKNNNECFSNSQKINSIKAFMSNYTLSNKAWELFDNTKDICKEYLLVISNPLAEGLEEWSIGEDDSHDMIRYLIFLGIKCRISFKNYDMDSVSRNVIRDEGITVNEKDRIIETKALTTYFLDQLNKNHDEISKENLLSTCEKMGLFVKSEKCFSLNKKELFILEKKKVDKFNENIRDLQGKDKKCYELHESSFCIIEKDSYSNVWDTLKDVLNLPISNDGEKNL